VFTKVLQLRPSERSRFTTGQLSTLMAVDAGRLNDSFIFPVIWCVRERVCACARAHERCLPACLHLRDHCPRC